MKKITTYIQEKLIVNNTIQDHINYKYHPKTIDELVNIIQEKIDKEGLGTEDNPLNLNDIDTSEITSMSNLFNGYAGELHELANNGRFDISDWNVSNVEDMHMMFAWSKFNGNISKWDVSNVKIMDKMFYECPIEKNPPKWFKRN